MDQVHISGAWPSLVILSQTNYFQKFEKWCQKGTNIAKAKMDGENPPTE